MQLASRFASRSPSLRSDYPLTDDQIHRVAPSIFADAPHESRSQRYAYIPTAAVLAELRKEGFQPFMVTQTRVHDEGKREHTKHMLRLRHASQINGTEANEIVLLNSHDGTSSYQMLAGMFRFVCSNGLVCGDTVADVRVPHKGDVSGHVIEGAYEVLRGFDRVKDSRDAMRAITLANVSPHLLADYPADAVALDQLMALAITDDHAAQESAFYDAPTWQRQPSALRDRLTEREIDAHRHPLVRFVGLDTYDAAGGGIRRDLFAEGDAGVYLTDAALLERLAQDKLAGIAAEVKAEGWAWVDGSPGMTHADLHTFQRAPRERREAHKREAARIEKLQAKLHELAEAVDAALDAEDEEKVDSLQEEGERLGEQLQALEDGLLDYGANVKAAAGAIVTIDRNGEAVIHRGLMREAEAKALRTLERLRQGFGSEGEAGNDDEDEEADDAPKTAAMFDWLAQRLSAHRTAALQIEVARHPQAALAAVVHGMVQSVLQEHRYGHDLPLGVSLKVQDRLEGMAPDWPESPAAVALRELQQVAGEVLPQDSAELFAVLLAKSQDELVRLLAVCVASTVDVVTPRATQHQPGAELAQAVGLDMAAWWQPTAEGYFQHVPKAAILDAVGAFAPAHVTQLAKLKKGDIASEAERLSDGTGWMPAIFRANAPQQDAQDVVADKEDEAPEDAAAVADEQPQAEPLAA